MAEVTKLNLSVDEINEQIKKLEEAKENLLKAEREKLEKQKEERKAEVDKALSDYLELRDKYIADYGYYKFSGTRTNPKLDFLDYFWN